MKHSIDELAALVRYYQHKAPWWLNQETEGGEEGERRLVAGRLAGAKYGTWRAMHKRIREQLPACAVHDHSFYLQGSTCCDGPFWADLELPLLSPEIGTDQLIFFVSTLAPYYVIYRQLWYHIPGSAPEGSADPTDNWHERHAINFVTVHGLDGEEMAECSAE
jgi:hypothetical protein